jgi:hypothetical protein
MANDKATWLKYHPTATCVVFHESIYEWERRINVRYDQLTQTDGQNSLLTRFWLLAKL